MYFYAKITHLISHLIKSYTERIQALFAGSMQADGHSKGNKMPYP